MKPQCSGFPFCRIVQIEQHLIFICPKTVLESVLVRPKTVLENKVNGLNDNHFDKDVKFLRPEISSKKLQKHY